MDVKSYDIIYKRKSVRKYAEEKLSDEKLKAVREQLNKLTPLDASIKIHFEIIPRLSTKAKFGEYSLLLYSEKKEGYLFNAGYLLEQMDIYFAENNIGACWYGLAKPDTQIIDGLDFVIMLVFGESEGAGQRGGIEEFNRKPPEKLFTSDVAFEALSAAGYAPSACNSQPWIVKQENNRLIVFRDTSVRTFIPKSRMKYFNSIDIGIFLFFLELSFKHFGFEYERFFPKAQDTSDILIRIAEYTVIKRSNS